ncbi:MAG: M14-type cytosolic carboxypeptidase [Sandaracinaceae bacterium]
MTLHISSAFDGGNIEVADVAGTEARLRIARDVGDRFLQWFYFRVTGGRDQDLVLRIENAGQATYRRGFVGYRAVASTDRERWRRVRTEFEGGVLTIRDRPARDAVWYAYFAPYPMTRHLDLIARCQQDPRVRVEDLGPTLDGQDLDLLVCGRGPRRLWVLARQHPGETMAEWWAEGFLDRLLDPLDPVSASLLEGATLYVVPNMNPDGSRRGHLRTNAVGTNLNRAWLEPSLEASPEVYRVRERMAAAGVDLCLDVHGDEELPFNFLAGPEGVPSFSERQRTLLAAFKTSLAALTPDFQTERGYPTAAKGEANLSLCTNYVAETFGCLAMTLEQPFKDTANRPHDEEGWSPGRAQRLGRSCVDALHGILPRLA